MLLLVLCLVGAGDPPRALDPGVKITTFAEAPDIVTPTGIAVDSKGRVLVIESHTHFRPEGYKGPEADRIRRFEDTNGDGRSDRITTVFEGSKHTMAMAFANDGALVVATRNEVFRLDLDAQGIASTPKKTLVRLDTPGNYPHNGLSGVSFDFGGDLYFGLGENLGAGYTLIGSDGTAIPGGGEGGNIYRCKADGSKLRQIATGFWNPFAMTFDAFGRLFAVDNDPDSRPPCRLLQIVEGGDYGYRFRNGRKGLHPFTSWNGELPGTLPMVAGTGEAPSGIVAYESDAFPQLVGDLLVTSWGDHRIDRFRPRIERDNATMTASVAPLVTGGEDFRPVGVAIAPDGSLFVSDWADKSYDLHGKGRIWHITPVKAPKRADLSAGPLHPDRAVREAAARSIATSGVAGRTRLRAILSDPNTEARYQATALEALVAAHDDPKAVLAASIASSQPAVLAEALRILPEEIVNTVEASQLLASVECLAEVARRGGPAREYVHAGKTDDPFLQQARRESIKEQMSIPRCLEQFRAEPDPKQRLQLLLTLRESASPESLSVLPQALADADPDVRFVAIQWIGEKRLVDHRERLVEALGMGSLTNRLFEGTLAAIDLIDGGKSQASDDAGAEGLVAKLLTDPMTTAVVRRRALRVLRPDHPLITPDLVASLLRSPDRDLRLEAIRTLRDSALPDRVEILRRTAATEAEVEMIRAEAVGALPGENDDEVALLLALAGKSSPLLKGQALRSLRGVKLTPDQQRKIDESKAKSPSDGPPFTPDLLDPAFEDRPFQRDSRSGELLFFHPKGPGCYKCHRVEGRGGRIGPDLTATGPTMTRARLLQSILEPSAEIAPQFTTWLVEQHDGTQIQGVLVEEAVNGDQTYADADGKLTKVRGSDLANRRPLPTSIMPADLSKQMTEDDALDLIAFIRREKSSIADNELSPSEQAAGYQLLFDGKTLEGWMTSTKQTSQVQVQEGAINPHGSGGYMMIHEAEWGNFVLSLDFKIRLGCNTGVFVRTSPLDPRPGKDVGFNGIEIAIDDTKGSGFHDTGAIYDLVKPRINAMKPAGEWNQMVIVCDGPKLVVRINDKVVNRMNLDEWTDPNRRPDGSSHKFDVAYKNHPRKGFIGLQDHGFDCWFKNIKIKPLP